MLFTSFSFFVFFICFFLIYWKLKKNLAFQNFIVLAGSYFFYGLWDVRFLSLILASTLVDFYLGIQIANESQVSKRKLYLWLSVGFNLGLLFTFKYFNFFIDSLNDLFLLFGINEVGNSLQIILPVGISFYTFQTMSYTIDIYINKMRPTYNFISFASFVAFFPQLVAGPIERAKDLLPQFYKRRVFNYEKAVDGLRIILWGIFKKVVIADNAASIVNLVYSDYTNFNGSALLVASLLFSVQIYCDFSGYSDIAIGLAKVLGFDLKQNFNRPYFSKNITEFWRNWHISLSSWFKDYVYIPLGGNRSSLFRNLFVVFLVSGLWHGANWTYVFWGFLNFILLAFVILKKQKFNIKCRIPFIHHFSVLFTFCCVTLCWVFFRSETISDAFSYLNILFSTSLFEIPKSIGLKSTSSLYALIVLFFVIEWIGMNLKHTLDISSFCPFYRKSIYFSIFLLIIYFSGNQQDFIYFQF